MTQPGTELATMPEGFQTGLEAFEESDAVIPRLSIVQKEGLFEDNLTGERFSEVVIIPLGLVKQRIMWPAQKGEGDDSPMCKSTNNIVGHPLVDAPKDKQFPWAHSGFDRAAFPPQPDGLIDLPCSACKLKEWGSHPLGKNPWCAEQWVVPVLYDGYGQGQFAPAILTLQRSGVKAIRAYLTKFQRSGSPAFVNKAVVKLDVFTRGDVVYSKPKFQQGEQTQQGEWPSFAMQFMQIKEYLERRPVSDDDAALEGATAQVTEVGANNQNVAPPVQQVQTQWQQPTVTAPQAPPPAQPVQQQAPPDQNQWATPPQQAAPQPPPPEQHPAQPAEDPWTGQPAAQQAPPPPAQPVQQQVYVPPPVVPQAAPAQPVQTEQPAAPPPEQPAQPAPVTPAPSQPAPVPSQPATQPAAAAPASPADPDDDLPF